MEMLMLNLTHKMWMTVKKCHQILDLHGICILQVPQGMELTQGIHHILQPLLITVPSITTQRIQRLTPMGTL